MVAGSSTPRTTVASMRIAVASPTPIGLRSCPVDRAKEANTATMTAAALVTTPAVERMPCAVAASVPIPPSTASRIRLRMNTW